MPKAEPRRALTAAQRQQRRRLKGKPVSTVLTDPVAIGILDLLTAEGLTQAHALELGLRALERAQSSPRKAQ